MAYTIATAYNLGTAASGTLSGQTNVGQTGDLSNWYYWTCPASGYYRIDTRCVVTAPGVPLVTTLTPYACSSSPHSPVISGDLTDLTSSELAGIGQQGGGYGAGMENGALVVIPCSAGTVYYFQVNSRNGGTGLFCLEWVVFGFVTLGACGTCTDVNTGLCKVGSGALTDVNLPTNVDGLYKIAEGCSSGYESWSEGVVTLGTYSSGYYYLIYCGGAIFNGANWGIGDGGGDTAWLLYSGAGDAYAGVWWAGDSTDPVLLAPVNVDYTAGQLVNYGGGNWYTLLNNVTYDWIGPYLPSPDWPAEPGPDCDTTNYSLTSAGIVSLWDGSGWAWSTQQDAELNAACLNFPICHTGGTVKIVWCFQNGISLTDGAPDPTFALYLFSPSVQIQLSVASISCSGASGGTYNYGVTITLKNTNLRFASGGFALSLQNAGVITGASASVPISSLAPGATTTASFTFSSTAINLLPATFQFLNCNGDVDGTQNLLLASAVVSVEYGNHLSCGTGTPVQYGDQYNLLNNGVIPCVIDYTISAPSVLMSTPAVLTTSGESGSPPDPICAATATVGTLTGVTATIPPSYSGGPDNWIYIQYQIKRSSTSAPTSQVITVAAQTSTGGVVFAPFSHMETLL